MRMDCRILLVASAAALFLSACNSMDSGDRLDQMGMSKDIGQVKQERRSTTTSSRVMSDDNTHITSTQTAVRSMVMEITGK